MYLVASGSINLVAILHSTRNNLPLLHIYTIVETVFLLLFFSKIDQHKRAMSFIKSLLIIFPLLCIINFSFFQSIYRFNSYVRPVEALILIFFSLYYYWHEMQEDKPARWTDHALNWIVAGILLYFSGALFQFIFSNIVSATASYQIKILILNIHGTLVLIMYLLWAIGFLKWKKN
ncbi:hypothetical protein [Chitinophaga flava]|uniref:Uncharacterized protein n=1 Tax=Chitinophaga flava TaxID=2259036 RepID=A0A365XWV0_9BACT|nr:hypothetical protein [Chitinophaga flava]RBL90174.1 hypothetical protein DF182_27285 [Chitinophaga flava]